MMQETTETTDGAKDRGEIAMGRLTAGNARYVADETTGAFRCSASRQELVAGQAPFAVVLACADSRVVPELIFDTGIGELFVIRVAGNVANTSSIASIEYAVANLRVPLIVVLGHQGCGAVSAALSGEDLGFNLNHLLAHLAPAKALAEAHDEVVVENAKYTAAALVERSKILREAVGASAVRIVPAYYDLRGSVRFLNAAG